ncbi:hypothetical protein KRR26_31250 [Corallococcus sp. M34]|uniref:DUF4097 family beta strand repeat-containing protein n=1 Tax=Citreicoccus inhibens TaxID=2849499 RepID=UPI001C250722|nr:hypothetical protein [Citreicoccus inhibens]MBU8900091.1 hypothetical protein [Citreicoccus inhibens]
MNEPETKPFSHEGPTRHELPWGTDAVLEIEADAAVLTVGPLTEGETPYMLVHGGVEAAVREVGKVTKVEFGAREPSGFFSFFLRAAPHVQLFLPNNLRARFKLDAGAIRIAGLQGCHLDVSTNAGAVKLRGVEGRLNLRTRAGAIFGEQLAGAIQAHTGAGTVKLDILSLTPGEHLISSQLGALEVRLAPNLDVRVEASTTLGSVRNRYPPHPNAAATLRLMTELGSVRVRGAGGGEQDDARDDHDPWRHDAERWQRQAERWHRRADRHAHRWARAWERAAPWGGAPADSHVRPPEPGTAGIPDEELRRVLQLVQDGKVSAEDAQKLLRAMQR